MKDWDDIRIFLAVARSGSITAGARSLGLDQSTVSRRLQAFEEKIGYNLFVGSSKRRVLSLIGEKYLKGAVNVEKEINSIKKNVAVSTQELKGTIHIVTKDILSNHLLLSVTSGFLQEYPDINLLIRSQHSREERLKGDVALFATNKPSEDMFGRKLATASFATYASQPYLDSLAGLNEDMVWLNWDDGSDSPTWPALAPEILDKQCRLRIDSVSTLLEAVRLGLGATILPCFIGESDKGLVRITPGETISHRDIWLLVHSDLRKVPRIRVFLDFLADSIKSRRPLIESS